MICKPNDIYCNVSNGKIQVMSEDDMEVAETTRKPLDERLGRTDIRLRYK